MSKKPAHEIRLGLIKATIWQNQTKSGQRYNVTLVRLFKNGDVWKESAHFGRDDLLPLSKVADMAHTWVYSQFQEPGYIGSTVFTPPDVEASRNDE